MERACICVENKDGKKDSAEFEDYLSIGRSQGNLLQIKEVQASRFHAEIVRKDDAYWLRDLHSTWGTLMDGAPINALRLKPGDRFTIGESRLTFELVDPESEFEKEDTVTRITFGDTALNAVGTSQITPDVDEPTPVGSEPVPELFTQLAHLRKRYRMLHQANHLISGEDPPAAVYSAILEMLFEVVPADRGVILAKDPAANKLVVMASRTRKSGIELKNVEMSTTLLKHAREQRVAVLTRDAMEEGFDAKSSIFQQQIRSAICAPLMFRGGGVLGFIYLDTLGTIKPFDKEMLDLVSAVAGPAGVAVKNAIYTERLRRKQEELQRSHLATLSVITSALEARDRYTVGHAQRVSSLGMAIADQLGWTAERRRQLEIGGLLHDVGKVGIRDAILGKPGQLSEDEHRVMRLHPDIGARILRDVPDLKQVIPYVLCHHERWDGKGYPQKLAGEQIPEEGRLLAVADAFDAMTSKRVYREPIAPEEALKVVQTCSGDQFDPVMVEAFEAAYEAGSILSVLARSKDLESRQVLCPICSTYLGMKGEVATNDQLDCPVCDRRFRMTDEHQAVLDTIRPK